MSESTRKLAAIVFTDIVGFTSLTAKDQQKASDLLDLQRLELKPMVEDNGGKWVKEMGDGLILTFNTITSAVQCCLSIQEKAKEIEDLSLRIGIHLGEILEREGDIIGDDVNIAARIEPFSAPGGIAVSNKVNDALVREKEYETKYLGKPKLKGVGQEVKVYCITSHGLPETKMSQVSAKLEKSTPKWYLAFPALLVIGIAVYLFIPNARSVVSVAIMYMEIRGDEADEYLQAITEDLIFDLASAVPGRLKVSEAATVRKYKDTDLEVSELAKRMGVQYVFKSSLQPSGNGYNLRCRLVEASTGIDKLLNKWFIESKNLQSIVSVLAENIIAGLDISLEGELRKVEYDPEAYELYLKAKDIYAKSDAQEKDMLAIDMMKDAIVIDDKLIAAQLKLGQMYYDNGEYKEAEKLYMRSFKKSKLLEDNTNIAESLRKQGQLFRKQLQFDLALEKFNEALSISTVMNDKNSMAKIMNSIAITYYKTERLEDALEYWLHALNIAKEFDDKLKISKYVNNIGIWYWKDDDYSRAIDYYEQSLAIKEELSDTRNYGKTLNNLGEVYYDMGDFANAIVQFDQSIAIKEKLNDNAGLNSTLLNLGQAQLYNTEYDSALLNFKRSLTISNIFNVSYQISDRYKCVGTAYFNLANYDSAAYYFEKADNIYLGDPINRLTTLSWLAITYMKKGQKKEVRDHVNIFDEFIKKNDPISDDIISLNWNMYQVYGSLGDPKSGKNYLENSYLEIRTRSKNIKNKEDRNKYLSVKLHQDIIDAWNM